MSFVVLNVTFENISEKCIRIWVTSLAIRSDEARTSVQHFDVSEHSQMSSHEVFSWQIEYTFLPCNWIVVLFRQLWTKLATLISCFSRRWCIERSGSFAKIFEKISKLCTARNIANIVLAFSSSSCVGYKFLQLHCTRFRKIDKVETISTSLLRDKKLF